MRRGAPGSAAMARLNRDSRGRAPAAVNMPASFSSCRRDKTEWPPPEHSLHMMGLREGSGGRSGCVGFAHVLQDVRPHRTQLGRARPSCVDRKSTRLNSSHVAISYAVFCLKKKKNKIGRTQF